MVQGDEEVATQSRVVGASGMKSLRWILAVSTGAIFVLPMVIVLLVGFSVLLRGLGDVEAGRWFALVATCGGAVWLASVAVSSAVGGFILLLTSKSGFTFPSVETPDPLDRGGRPVDLSNERE